MHPQTNTLVARVEAARNAVAMGAPVVHAFHARRRLVLSGRSETALWALLAIVVFPLVLFGLTAWNAMVISIASVAIAQLVAAMVARGTTRVLGLASDGSVIVARTPWFSSKIRGIERIHVDVMVAVEPTTPGWRTQRVQLDGTAWYHCQKSTHFVRRNDNTNHQSAAQL